MREKCRKGKWCGGGAGEEGVKERIGKRVVPHTRIVDLLLSWF